jgi:hypothetical protein
MQIAKVSRRHPALRNAASQIFREHRREVGRSQRRLEENVWVLDRQNSSSPGSSRPSTSLGSAKKKDVDARHKAGHDELV